MSRAAAAALVSVVGLALGASSSVQAPLSLLELRQSGTVGVLSAGSQQAGDGSLEKGLWANSDAIRPGAVFTFRLNGGFDTLRLQTLAAGAPSSGGKITLAVMADSWRVGLLRLTPGAPPTTLYADIRGAESLTIRVEEASGSLGRLGLAGKAYPSPKKDTFAATMEPRHGGVLDQRRVSWRPTLKADDYLVTLQSVKLADSSSGDVALSEATPSPVLALPRGLPFGEYRWTVIPRKNGKPMKGFATSWLTAYVDR